MIEKHQNKSFSKAAVMLLTALFLISTLSAQQQYELNTGWQCSRASAIAAKGEKISMPSFALSGWLPATVPGTVLTSLLNNKLIPDPFYGMNNKLIPDIYNAGRDYYTYWFVKDFEEQFPEKDEHVFLQFRGINYSCDIYLNGHKLNAEPDRGMFLRESYDIAPFMAQNGRNRLAVIVYPPDPAGNPNGGQGGDGTIAHSITNQYVAGWDWIQPVADRNTGIWDKVFIKRTKQVSLENTHVITYVPGKRDPYGKPGAARIKVTAEVENNSETDTAEGIAQYVVEGKRVSVKVKLEPQSMQLVTFPELTIDSARLWWPNGYGPQNLYDLKVKFILKNKTVSDEENVTFGIREIKAVWNAHTNSREIRVNGQKIFIKGGNRILSDELLRFSKERYDAELRYHRDMNLNLIRVWGGGITERPEFYDACDKYGLLVMQDFWVSGDCNGAWYDTLKREDTNTRRCYPDDHELFKASLEDQIKMLRNHPSLALWCGGNEIRPPKDVLYDLRDTLLPELDGTRFLFEYSNDDSMSLHSGDGPYTIQPAKYFWEHRSFPFNSEVGSVGIGDYESLARFIPEQDMVAPKYNTAARKWDEDSVWAYHRYIGYDSMIEMYGHAADVRDFAKKAQLLNYDQYRALMEGAVAHAWDWYTGIIDWKTQNPWTAMRGQMYDVYLDPNACMYGMSEGAKPVHIMYDQGRKTAMLANNSCQPASKLKVTASVIDMHGATRFDTTIYSSVAQNKITTVNKFPSEWDVLKNKEGVFYLLQLNDSASGSLVDENLYWLPDKSGSYAAMAQMPQANVAATAKITAPGKAELQVGNTAASLAFFIRISLVDAKTKKRILPVFCNNNYFSILPAGDRTVAIDFTPQEGVTPMISIEGWNVDKMYVDFKN